jgi:phosphoglycerol transferase MdoB-like AlkP superfamily enzyme
MKNGYIPPAIATGMTNNLTTLQDTVSNLERILNTPLPFAYQAHLRMSIWLYLFFLPFQITTQFGWITIPGTAFASFLFLGFLEIGQEIGNPFNYDLNDLDLDYFCLAIQRELHLITAYPAPDPSAFIFSSLNQPFAPADRRSAKELAASDTYLPPDGTTEPGWSSLKRTLVKGWKDVDSLTRR